jgi:hypothetical protein
VAVDVWQGIVDAIKQGDTEAVVTALEQLDEDERKRLSTRAKQAADVYAPENRWAWNSMDKRTQRRRAADAALAAVFGTGGSAAAARMWWIPDNMSLRERLIRTRPPEWRQDWAERAMSERDPRHWDWPVVRRMVTDGLIERPSAIGYLVGAVGGMHSQIDHPGTGPRVRVLAETLRAAEDFLQHELWRFFEVEEIGLSSRDGLAPRWGGQSWQQALCELADEGTVSRQRLLDESLAALRRDFSPHNARWFHKLYEALEPTEEEQLERLDDLLALVAASDPAVVGFALRGLAKVERKNRLPADRVLEAVPPAALLPVKAHATRAVKLVGSVMKREPTYAPIALPVLVQALAHESRDVQESVVELLERHADALADDDRARLAATSEDVDPALRARIDALAGVPSDRAANDVQVTAGPAVEVPPRRPHDPSAARLTTPLSPPGDVDELLDRLAVGLERGDDPYEIELVLDGVSRFRDQPVSEGRAVALLERAGEHTPFWAGVQGFSHARDALAAAALRWLGGAAQRKLRFTPTGASPREALALRVRELLDDLGGPPRELLSTPTHAGGWIDAHEAVRRVRDFGGRRPPVIELAQMVLRVAPDGRERARADAAKLSGEAAAVLTYGLGGDSKRPLGTKLRAAWDAAANARDPEAFAIPQRPLDDYGSMRASFIRAGNAKIEPASPAELLLLPESWWGWEAGGIERWLTTVWPANREAIFHLVVRRLWTNTGERLYGIEDVLEVALDDREPIRDEAALAIALALGSADMTHRALAVDVAIAAFATRRLDGVTLGRKLERILREQEAAVPSRWKPSLEDVAAAGPLQAHDVQAAIETTLAAAAESDRRRLLGLVDLLRSLAVDAGAAVANPKARDWLSSLGSGSKIGRAAVEALRVTGDGAARSRAAVAQVSAGSVITG